MEIKATRKQIHEAAKSSYEANQVLRELLPEAFGPEEYTFSSSDPALDKAFELICDRLGISNLSINYCALKEPGEGQGSIYLSSKYNWALSTTNNITSLRCFKKSD